jgi:hypothetical protein
MKETGVTWFGLALARLSIYKVKKNSKIVLVLLWNSLFASFMPPKQQRSM